MDIDGKNIDIAYRPQQKNTPSQLTLSFKGDFSAHAAFHRETMMDGVGKKLGINQEIELNDPDFDKEVYIECDDADFIRQFLPNVETRNILRKVLKDFTLFQVNGQQCSLVKSPAEPLDALPAEFLSGAARNMLSLARSIPPAPIVESSATPLTDEFLMYKKCFLIIGAVTIAAGAGCMIWSFIAYEILDGGAFFMRTLSWSLPAYGLFMFLVLQVLRGHAASFKTLATGGFLALIGFVLAFYGVGSVMNGALDHSSGKEHAAFVAGKHISYSRNSTTYHVMVSFKEPRMPEYDFLVSRWIYDERAIFDPCVIMIKDGLLGAPWVISKECHSTK
ncbi:MAG: hypothetical protein HQL19_04555 [Candidatus Omnitrophica bacterium]|nr:hypothetical protein [Candidatus Omnitrophota bacterium]